MTEESLRRLGGHHKRIEYSRKLKAHSENRSEKFQNLSSAAMHCSISSVLPQTVTFLSVVSPNFETNLDFLEVVGTLAS